MSAKQKKKKSRKGKKQEESRVGPDWILRGRLYCCFQQGKKARKKEGEEKGRKT